MGARHNRRRTRSRPRHRDAGKARSLHDRTNSFDTNSSYSSSLSSFPQPSAFPLASRSSNHWHQTYSAWQDRLRQQQEEALEAQRLRLFGGEAGDEVSLLEPMLKVVTDLFDGHLDYIDP
ncbi:hypothetical protein K432DRAFT_420409 [Lepidopterella palustris CBS 459.81]|uniref:Uncharacterized protein n=1 Tax=Lepidopterella palustris CBS 459.81 TaxID=1314670 RepID=A0A8E2DYR4_9PEZI|nr:hypothetical protein K432DRAFT_420409 [Lepidopterella palustris CBS 459.81]